jgi:hypothetical protein
MMVVAMPASDASSKVSLNHNDQDATPHGGASCCDSMIGDLHWYIAYPKLQDVRVVPISGHGKALVRRPLIASI